MSALGWIPKKIALKGRPKGLFGLLVCDGAMSSRIAFKSLVAHGNGRARILVRAPFQGASTMTVVPRAEALGYSV